MNECPSCLGSGKSIMVGSNMPYTEFDCKKCNGTAQDPIPPNTLITLLQLNDYEKNMMPTFWWSCPQDIAKFMPTTDEIIDNYRNQQIKRKMEIHLE